MDVAGLLDYYRCRHPACIVDVDIRFTIFWIFNTNVTDLLNYYVCRHPIQTITLGFISKLYQISTSGVFLLQNKIIM